MLYNKPRDVRYVDMCIWIDANAYLQDRDDNKFFQYLFHIFYMLAFKSRYFNSSKEYDDFAVYAATKMYMRYNSKREGIEKVKSILNYAKRVIYPYKVQFQQQEYKENNYSGQVENEEDIIIDNSFKLKIEENIDSMNKIDFKSYLSNFSKTVRFFVSRTPYKSNYVDYGNLYVSCMLTFINNITPSIQEMSHIENISRSDKIRDNLYDKIYSQLPDEVILYHLDDSLKDYVKVLVNQVKQLARKELVDIIQTNSFTDDIINDMHKNITNDLYGGNNE